MSGELRETDQRINAETACEAVAVKSEPTTPERAIAAMEKTPERPSRTPTKSATATPPVLQIKPEPGAPELLTEAEQHVPDSFFDDLLQSAEEIGAAAMSSPPPPPSMQEKEADEPPTVVKAEAKEQEDATPAAQLTSPPAEDAAEEGELTAVSDAAASSSPRIKNEAPEEVPPAESIPEHFFDDLLVDRFVQRVENHHNEELEIKYATKLQSLREQLRELEAADPSNDCAEANRSHKKKKSKKKSRKRSHSREHRSRSRSRERKSKRSKNSDAPAVLPPQEISGEHLEAGDEEEESGGERPRSIAVKSEFRSFGPSVYAEQLECSSVQFPAAATTTSAALPLITADPTSAFAGFKRIKLERRPSKETVAVVPLAPTLDNDVQLVITPRMKRERALQRSGELIKEFQKAKKDEIKSAAPPALTRFHYTATVRKLPTSSSYVKQQIYENRSPLHTVNNVSYNFNSHATRFNMQEWGLEALPAATKRVAQILGYDAQTLSVKQKTTRLPAKLAKIKSEAGVDADGGECVDETRSSFFTNAMTQTDPVTVTAGRQNNGHEVGVQATPHHGSIGTQTEEAATSTEPVNSGGGGAYDDLPLMQHIGALNENQLMALQDFAELIRESGENGAANVMDMFRLRQRMLDIYKCSQLPSAMAVVSPPLAAGSVVAAPMTVPPPKTSPLQITGVFSLPPVDPRTGFPVRQAPSRQQQQPAYVQKNSGHPPPQQQHIRMQQQYAVRPQHQQQQQPYHQRTHGGTQPRKPAPNPNVGSPKFYGRGGMRR